MYGRFGMQTEPVKDEIVTPARAVKIARDFQVKNCIAIGGLELISYKLDLAINQHPETKPKLRKK